jgi:hypothetical protein
MHFACCCMGVPYSDTPYTEVQLWFWWRIHFDSLQYVLVRTCVEAIPRLSHICYLSFINYDKKFYTTNKGQVLIWKRWTSSLCQSHRTFVILHKNKFAIAWNVVTCWRELWRLAASVNNSCVWGNRSRNCGACNQQITLSWATPNNRCFCSSSVIRQQSKYEYILNSIWSFSKETPVQEAQLEPLVLQCRSLCINPATAQPSYGQFPAPHPLPLSRCHRANSDVNGRAIAQAVSRRLPTAAARVRAQARSCGICGGQSGTGAGLSEYFGFPCQFSFQTLLHTHHLLVSSGAGIIGQLVADVPSGLSLTPPQETKKSIKVLALEKDWNSQS